jgi:hypothetical protein
MAAKPEHERHLPPIRRAWLALAAAGLLIAGSSALAVPRQQEDDTPPPPPREDFPKEAPDQKEFVKKEFREKFEEKAHITKVKKAFVQPGSPPPVLPVPGLVRCGKVWVNFHQVRYIADFEEEGKREYHVVFGGGEQDRLILSGADAEALERILPRGPRPPGGPGHGEEPPPPPR